MRNERNVCTPIRSVKMLFDGGVWKDTQAQMLVILMNSAFRQIPLVIHRNPPASTQGDDLVGFTQGINMRTCLGALSSKPRSNTASCPLPRSTVPECVYGVDCCRHLFRIWPNLVPQCRSSRLRRIVTTVELSAHLLQQCTVAFWRPL